MDRWERVEPSMLCENFFVQLSREWALLTAGDRVEDCNTMTVSWGGTGILWNKPVATVYVRPQRYTLGFMERSEHFTLSFFAHGEYRDALTFCGSQSGREHDKFRECGLTPEVLDGGVAVAQARLVLVCRKLYWSDIDPAHLLDASLVPSQYPNRDFHRMFIGEILGTYRKPGQDQ